MEETSTSTSEIGTNQPDVGINWYGVAGVAVFYLVILFIGIWAARRGKQSQAGTEQSEAETTMLAGRSIGPIVGIFTMTATWVGGGYINGTAEMLYANGLVSCEAPFGYSISLALGGFFFAKKMRDAGYITMLDPFQIKFGNRMGGLLFIPALLGEVFWSAAILSALGATLSVILNIGNTLSVIVSALIAIGYTLFGGLFAVAYTDVVQLLCIIVGLVLSIPFAANHESVQPLDTVDWFGTLPVQNIGSYVDSYLLLIFGGIPWQAYFQRVLSSQTSQYAQVLSFSAAVGCLILSVPPIVIGAIAKATNWELTQYGRNIPEENQKLVLPLVLRYLCPAWVSMFGLGAVAAAVMSSADSSILSASSMFSRNVYKLIFRPNASDRELIWVMRVAIFGVGSLACLFALTISSVYGLWFLCGDLVYVILFPQLVCVVYIDFCNLYGSLSGYIVGWVLRLGGGESMIGLPAFIPYPGFHQDEFGLPIQPFPFRTLAMLCSFLTVLLVSFGTKYLFEHEIVDPKYDFFHCFFNQEQTFGDEKQAKGITPQVSSCPSSEGKGKENKGFERNEAEGDSRRSSLQSTAV